MRKKIFNLLAVVMILSMVFTATVSAQAPTPNPDQPSGRIDLPHTSPFRGEKALSDVAGLLSHSGTVRVMVELQEKPTTLAYTSRLSDQGPSLAAQAAVSQMQTIQSAQSTLVAKLTSDQINAQVIYTAQRVYNGIAISVDAKNLKAIAALPGVKAIHPLVAKKLDNAYSVPLINAPQTWALGGVDGNLGTDIKIGVIDTGIDYLHTNFGGPGEGYALNDTTTADDTPGVFPGAKVAGGYDFVGDDYDADVVGSVPAPDDDPMDCNGHGSHVSGTIAGYGVNADGSTYEGVYSTSTDFANLRIGPGVAPEAELYGLRVFGCGGTTDVVTEALDWAIDPNGDGNPEDHLDVVNMSLGSSYGNGYDPDSVASDNAVAAGVIVVASAGNEGDSYYIAGSPGDSTRAISVAASVDSADTWDGFEVNAPAGIAGVYYSTNSVAYDWADSEDVTGDLVYPEENETGCSTFPDGYFDGKVALLDWSQNECGSATRSNNAYAAGAIGVIMAYDLPRIDIAITGSAYIPATLTSQATGEILKDSLDHANTVTVTFSNEYAASVVNVDTTQEDTLASFSSRGPRGKDSFLKPDITAPGMTIFSTSALTGDQGESLNGTSMAAPHITGVMALLRQLHPDWTVEELKALAMNTANHALFTGDSHSGHEYAPARVGAGRVDAYNAAQSEAVMFNADDPGAVSVSFGAPQVITTASLTKNITVENKSAGDITYTPAFSYKTLIPGTSFSLLDENDHALVSLTVPAEGSATFKVKLDIDAAQMAHSRDVTVPGTQNSDARQWLSEVSGLITLSVLGDEALRLPVYAAPRPASSMAADTSATEWYPDYGDIVVPLDGTGVDTTSSFNPPTGELSLVSAFQLLASSPNEDIDTGDPSMEGILDAADLHYIGVASDANGTGIQPKDAEMFLAIATQGAWSSPNEVEFDVYLDVDQDGVEDYVLFNWNYGAFLGGDTTDTFLTVLVDLVTGDAFGEDYVDYYPSTYFDLARFNSNVMVLPVYLADMGVSRHSGPIDAYIVSYSTNYPSPMDISPVMSFDPNNLILDTGAIAGYPLFQDAPGNAIEVTYNPDTWQENPVIDLLLVHYFNEGDQAEIASLLPNKLMMPLIFQGE